MSASNPFEIFLVAIPGMEALVCDEARACGFAGAKVVDGGVAMRGGWGDVWRANLELRGGSRVLARITSFRAMHLSQLDKRARRVAWGDVLRADVPFRVEASCSTSRIYHSGAAAQRIERAIGEELGAPVSPDAVVCVKARIENDLCSIAVDTSGEPLHKRGHKQAVAKAPMRETLAALLLRQCDYDGSEPVVDPMCGSGTFMIEAAEIAVGLKPGRSRRFAFEQLATFDEEDWKRLRGAAAPSRILDPSIRFYGSDHNAHAINMSRANAERAGVSALCDFRQLDIEKLARPSGPPGLVIVNPPYGDRIGDKQGLRLLYRALGRTLLARFTGWRIGLVTSEPALAKATGLPFARPFGPVSHGGLRVWLHTCQLA